MGAGSSTPRSITIEEQGANGVVKVSESVARRLVGKPVDNDRQSAGGGDEAGTHLTVSRPVPTEQLESELATIREQYERRIEALEKQNRELHQTTVDEFAKAVEDVEKKFLKATAPLVCDELQNKLMQCYRENPNQVLNCSQMVREYGSCVERERGSLLRNIESDLVT